MGRGENVSLGISTVSAVFPRRNAIGVDSAGFLGSSIVPGIASLEISAGHATFPSNTVGADCAGFWGSSTVLGEDSLGVSTVSATFLGSNVIRMDSTDFLGSSAVTGITSLPVSVASTIFPGRSAVRVNCTGFLGSSTILEIASLGISPVNTNFLGRSAVGGGHTGFLESSADPGRTSLGVSIVSTVFPEESDIRADCAGLLGSSAVLGKGVTTWGVVLVAWEASQVIFPSFLHSKLFNLFTYLLFTLLNLSSLIFSMKPWHFPKIEVNKIYASFDLHSSLGLALLSRILLMDLILTCSNCFSAILIIFLAFCVLKVDFNLILTGNNNANLPSHLLGGSEHACRTS